jgi:hypothetical protein
MHVSRFVSPRCLLSSPLKQPAMTFVVTIFCEVVDSSGWVTQSSLQLLPLPPIHALIIIDLLFLSTPNKPVTVSPAIFATIAVVSSLFSVRTTLVARLTTCFDNVFEVVILRDTLSKNKSD